MKQSHGELQRICLHVEGMDCPDEIEELKHAFKGRSNILDLSYNLMRGTMTVIMPEHGHRIVYPHARENDVSRSPIPSCFTRSRGMSGYMGNNARAKCAVSKAGSGHI